MNTDTFRKEPAKSMAAELEVTPQQIARAIISSHAVRILVVRHVEANGLVSGWNEGDANLRRHSCAYLLREDGRWETGPEPWYELVDEVLWRRYQEAEETLSQSEALEAGRASSNQDGTTASPQPRARGAREHQVGGEAHARRKP